MKRTLRTLHVSYEYPPSSWGGLGTYLADLVHHQRLRGDEVTVMYVGPGPAPVGCVGLEAFGRNELRDYSLDELRARLPHVDYDLVVCHDWPGLLACRALWRRGIPLVYTCHLPLDWDIGDVADIPCGFSKELEFAGLAFADRIVAVSEAVRTFVERAYPFCAGRVQTCRSGSDTEFFSPDAATPVDGRRLLFVGRFCEQKGFDLLPDVFEAVADRHPGVTLDIIGTGPLRDAVFDDFASRGLGDAVRWLEFSSLRVVRDLYRRAAVVLMPSRLEPFGLVATEAMACGIPVVASDTGGLREIVTSEHDGVLVAPGDVRGFADAAVRLLTDAEAAASIRTRARRTAVARFDRAAAFDGVREVYHSVTSAAARTRPSR